MATATAGNQYSPTSGPRSTKSATLDHEVRGSRPSVGARSIHHPSSLETRWPPRPRLSAPWADALPRLSESSEALHFSAKFLRSGSYTFLYDWSLRKPLSIASPCAAPLKATAPSLKQDRFRLSQRP
jgi:hypothetical protein